MSWPAFLRFAAHLRHEFSRADRLKNTASAAANLPPPRYLIQQAMASPPTSDTAKIGSTSLKSTLGTSLLQTTGKGYAKKVTGATQSLKAANADDMEIIEANFRSLLMITKASNRTCTASITLTGVFSRSRLGSFLTLPPIFPLPAHPMPAFFPSLTNP